MGTCHKFISTHPYSVGLLPWNIVQGSSAPCLASSPDLLFAVPLCLAVCGSGAEIGAFLWSNYFAESLLFRINL